MLAETSSLAALFDTALSRLDPIDDDNHELETHVCVDCRTPPVSPARDVLETFWLPPLRGVPMLPPLKEMGDGAPAFKPARSSTPRATSVSLGRWTDADDAKLVECHKRYGNAWRSIANEFPTRSSDAVRSRVFRLDGGFKRVGAGAVEKGWVTATPRARRWSQEQDDALRWALPLCTSYAGGVSWKRLRRLTKLRKSFSAMRARAERLGLVTPETRLPLSDTPSRDHADAGRNPPLSERADPSLSTSPMHRRPVSASPES
jgi:hypothetical protein